MRSETRWLYRAFLPLLMIGYAFVVAGLVAVVATWPSRPIGSPADIAWWSPAIAVVIVVLTWAPVSAQLDRSVHQLAYGQRDDAYEVTGRVYRQLSDDLLPTLAAVLAGTLALPYVEIEAGGHVVTTHGTARIMAFFAGAARTAEPFPDLTPSERKVLQLLARGLSNEVIAGELSLSAKTVRNYVSTVFSKLHVASRAQAIVRARDAGIS